MKTVYLLSEHSVYYLTSPYTPGRSAFTGTSQHIGGRTQFAPTDSIGTLVIDDDPDAIPRLHTFTLRELMDKPFRQVECVVEDLLPPGLALLASPPKYGKSWMVLDLCLSVVREQPFLGHRTNRARCLYLALEDSEQRLQTRVAQLLNGEPVPYGLDLAIHAEDLSTGLYQQLNEAFNRDPALKLVVIDTLQKIRGSAKGREGAYQYDYREMAALKGLADAFGATILLVHHMNKGGDDSDPHNRINGTTGILGAADTSIVLTKGKRYDEVALMSVTGRDVESFEQPISFNKETCRWELVEEEPDETAYERSPIVHTIRHLLEEEEAWKGGATELMQLGRDYTGFELATSARRLNSVLREELAPMLEARDGIRYRQLRNGTGGARIELYRIGTTAHQRINANNGINER